MDSARVGRLAGLLQAGAVSLGRYCAILSLLHQAVRRNAHLKCNPRTVVQRIYFPLRLLALVSRFAFAALSLAFYSGCGTKDETLAVLRDYGISGITPSKVLHLKAAPALNQDYRNMAYFLVLKATEDEFNQFVTTNRFVRSEVLLVPMRGVAEVDPEPWWNPPPVQTNCYMLKSGKVFFTTVWSQDRVYLYGRD